MSPSTSLYSFHKNDCLVNLDLIIHALLNDEVIMERLTDIVTYRVAYMHSNHSLHSISMFFASYPRSGALGSQCHPGKTSLRNK